MKLAWKRKSDKIKDNLQILENKLDITKDDKKPRKRALKLLIKQEVNEAKVKYIEQQKESIGLAA